MTKRELNEKITRLEKFVTEHLQGLQKQVDDLREAGSETWERLDSRTKDLEDFCASMRDMIRAIIKHLHIPYETMRRLLKEVDAEWHTDRTKDLGGELEKEADLFSAKRTKGETINEATERNLISLEGLRMRYGWKKAEIRGAVRDLGLEFEAIEGSPLSYINKGKIAELKDYFAKKG